MSKLFDFLSSAFRVSKQACINIYFRAFFSRSINDSGPVFIIGTGRSGTHFLCSCLNLFPSLDDAFNGKESKYIFNHLTDLTVNSKALTKSVIGYYRCMMNSVYPKIFLDQTHPNIWHVEQLLNAFPGARFIAISRDVSSVVYSMKNHEGVAAWGKSHLNYPKPNRFLGITEKNKNVYENHLTELQRYVFRWCSHEDRIAELIQKFPRKVLHVRYEDLAQDMEGQMVLISDFLEVEPPAKLSEFNKVSLHKKDGLSYETLQEIEEALNIYSGKY